MDSQWIAAFRLIPYGIYLLATRRGSDLQAMIVSWVSQVSYSPPLLMIALRGNRKIIPALQESRYFSLSLLKDDQKGLVSWFKEPLPPSKCSELFEKAPSTGSPLLKGCLASWECQLFSTMEAGDHILILGKSAIGLGGPGRKSAHHRGSGEDLHRPILRREKNGKR